MNFDSGVQASRRDFIMLMSSLGLVALTDTGCAFIVPGVKQQLPKISLRRPDLTGRLNEDQLTRLWEVFDYIGTAWENREHCTIQNLQQFEPIITLKTAQTPSYLTEYRAALEIDQGIRENFNSERALHRLYFEQSNEHLRHFVIVEFLRLHIASGGFRFLQYRNAVGFTGGPFDNDDQLPYRGLGDSC